VPDSNVLPAHVVIERCIASKDGNRPAGFERTFSVNAEVQISAKNDTDSFPPHLTGREDISKYLVGVFNSVYENIYTFCLSPPPQRVMDSFSCLWLITMTVKEDKRVRVGWGHYDWHFDPSDHGLCKSLNIQIEDMITLSAEHHSAVVNWVQDRPCPWVEATDLLAFAPTDKGFAAVKSWLS